MFYKKLNLLRFLLSSDGKIKWFKWDLKWQLESSIYLFSAKGTRPLTAMEAVKRVDIAATSTA